MQDVADLIEITGIPAPSSDALVPIRAIRQVFENYFDRSWFAKIFDELHIDRRMMRSIRDLVGLRSLLPGDERDLHHGIRELDRFIRILRRQLLPHVRDRLGISGLSPSRRTVDPTRLVLLTFVASVFGHNLDKLARATAVLKEVLYRQYPHLDIETFGDVAGEAIAATDTRGRATVPLRTL